MCSIRDLVDIRSVTPPLKMWTVRKQYQISKSDDGRLFATYSDELVPGESVSYRTNELFIDALEAGEKLESGTDSQLIAKQWIEKYGFTPTFNEKAALSGSNPNGIINCITHIYMQFCMFLKAKYGYDVFIHKEIKKHSVSACANNFFLEVRSSKIISFEGCNIKIEQDSSGLHDTLSSMLADYVTTDNQWQQFLCKMCGKTSIRRNPKKCYCNECSKKRYQISRQKKRLEGR